MKKNSFGLIALLPFAVFLVFYLGLSIYANDFYSVPMPIAFIVASATAFLIDFKTKLNDKVEVYAKGMGDSNIMIMCLVFILAGAFASVAKEMGAVDAAVRIAQYFIPANMMLCGVFLVSCFISLSIGTSCGTIGVITPIAIGLALKINIPVELMLGAVVGGAMFGDNMSMISDTTIAATRTQSVAMRDKFITNLRIAVPAAIAAVVLYLFLGSSADVSAADIVAKITWEDAFLVAPYVFVLIFALVGVNVMSVLFLGIVMTTVIGLCYKKFEFFAALQSMGAGSLGMSETLIVALLAGGLLGLIRYYGGISYLLATVNKFIKGIRGCEFGVSLVVSAVNLITANNTVAIVIAGPVARELSEKYGCNPKRIAAILDVASCIVQGLIPYGAQILIAVGVATNPETFNLEVSALALIKTMYYQLLMIVALIAFIVISGKKKV
ncbi:MAG: Na+/H+ antiporter NhaC family protein [Kiritimatiellae bacterium]|nr:Na+/H+ antiporter NhaC family protein [Kiritimatiellia bacterium]